MNKNDFQILLNLFQELTYINDVSGSLRALARSIQENNPSQIDKNGFFGQIQGPFQENQNIMLLIKQQCNMQQGTNDNIYISKIGFYSLKKFENNSNPIISLNEKQISLGQMGMLELENVYITSITALQNIDNTFFIDYQYQRI